jgi:hypothetical protein
MLTSLYIPNLCDHKTDVFMEKKSWKTSLGDIYQWRVKKPPAAE